MSVTPAVLVLQLFRLDHLSDSGESCANPHMLFHVVSCCRALLKRGSVSLVPGGIAEMFLWEANREAIKVGAVWEGWDQAAGNLHSSFLLSWRQALVGNTIWCPPADLSWLASCVLVTCVASTPRLAAGSRSAA